jgi:Spy/CpxP family protein refolding chaperone
MRTGFFLALLSLWGALLTTGAAIAQNAGQPQSGAPPHFARQRPTHADALERRVQLLTHELDLNAQQQQAVRKILLAQREAVKQIWQDPEIAPAERAPAVRLAGERTADEIRVVLNEEQKKKYNRPLLDGELSTRANTDVEGWLRTVRGQTTENPLGVTLPAGQ